MNLNIFVEELHRHSVAFILVLQNVLLQVVDRRSRLKANLRAWEMKDRHGAVVDTVNHSRYRTVNAFGCEMKVKNIKCCAWNRDQWASKRIVKGFPMIWMVNRNFVISEARLPVGRSAGKHKENLARHLDSTDSE